MSISARRVLLTYFASVFLFYFLLWPVLDAFSDAYLLNESIVDVVIHIVAFILIINIARKRLTLHGLWPGKIPDKSQVAFYLLLAFPMVGMSALALALVFVPLSYWLPNVAAFFLEIEFELWVYDGSLSSLVSTLLRLLTLVILAPVVEELIFRWLLIERWKAKYSTNTAVILSSLIFGILHADLLGAFIFGVVLSAIYLHTRSLWGPILIHVGNNALVAILVLKESPSELSVVAELQAEWPVMVLMGVAMLLPGVFVAWYLGAFQKFKAIFAVDTEPRNA